MWDALLADCWMCCIVLTSTVLESLANSHSLAKLSLHFLEENPRVDWRPIFDGFFGNVPPWQNQKYPGTYECFPVMLGYSIATTQPVVTAEY